MIWKFYTLSHLTNDRGVTERVLGYTMQDASFMGKSWCFFFQGMRKHTCRVRDNNCLLEYVLTSRSLIEVRQSIDGNMDRYAKWFGNRYAKWFGLHLNMAHPYPHQKLKALCRHSSLNFTPVPLNLLLHLLCAPTSRVAWSAFVNNVPGWMLWWN